jgi:hypothetical protein
LLPDRVAEARRVADAGVVDLTRELDAGPLERVSRLLDIRDAEAEPAVLGQGDREVAGLVLDPVLVRARVAGEAERPAVELVRTRDVGDGAHDEVDALDLDHGIVPSAKGP